MTIIQRVPKLNVRTKHLIKVYSQRELKAYDDNTKIDTEILFKNITKQPAIGAIQKLKISTSRDYNDWRELNYDTLGRIMEVYPTLPEYSVSVERIALFKSHLLDAFSAVDQDVFAGDPSSGKSLKAGFNVYNQITPITLVVDILNPVQSDYKTSSNIVVVVYDCWFDKSEIEFDITADRDLAIIQSATLTCAGLLTYKPTA